MHLNEVPESTVFDFFNEELFEETKTYGMPDIGLQCAVEDDVIMSEGNIALVVDRMDEGE